MIVNLKGKLNASDPCFANQTYTITLFPEKLNQVNFITELQKEVRNNPQKAKKLLSFLTKTNATLTSWLTLTTPTMASSLSQDMSTTAIDLYVQLGWIAILATIVALMLAGIWQIFMGKEKVKVWRADIIKGLLQTLLAPLIVVVMLLAINFLFPNSEPLSRLTKPVLDVFLPR